MKSINKTLKPIKNPYVINNPISQNLLFGRDDILKQLEELWLTGNQLQSVVLYGNRRMGKTSILVNSEATKTILTNPISSLSRKARRSQNPEDNEFLLDYTEEALELIYSLTNGQPYLVQLIGFQLVRNYNNAVFEQGRSRNNTFTVEDIEAVINPKFFQQGRYYFEGVWEQAAQGVTEQQNIITALALHREGLSKKNLASTTGLDTAILEAAIKTLERHEVIAKQNTNYQFVIKLFHNWLNRPSDGVIKEI